MSIASATALYALCGILVPIVTIVSALRFYARKTQHTEFGIDDWMVIPSYTVFIGAATCALIGVQTEHFEHHEQGSAATRVPVAHEISLFISINILSTVSVGFTRISSLLFHRRIFCVRGRTTMLRTTIHISVVVISLWMAAFIILLPLQHKPGLGLQAVPTAIQQYHYHFSRRVVIGLCISDLAIEVIVIAMPVPKILSLHTTLRRRLGVLFVFSSAFLSLGGVVARLVIVLNLVREQMVAVLTANTEQTFMWILEASFALIAVNLPSLWCLIRKTSPASAIGNIDGPMLSQPAHSESKNAKVRRTEQHPLHDSDTKNAEFGARETLHIS